MVRRGLLEMRATLREQYRVHPASIFGAADPFDPIEFDETIQTPREPAGREIYPLCQVRHAESPVRCFGEMHEDLVIRERQTLGIEKSSVQTRHELGVCSQEDPPGSHLYVIEPPCISHLKRVRRGSTGTVST